MNKTNIIKDYDINSEQVYLSIDSKLIIKNRDELISQAKLDLCSLVKLAEKDGIPICVIKNIEKEQYELSKSRRKIALNAVSTSIIQISPNIDDNDLAIKAKKILDLQKSGHNVSIHLKFKRGFRKKMNKDHDLVLRLKDFNIDAETTKSDKIFNVKKNTK